jgi:hypothetical protein
MNFKKGNLNPDALGINAPQFPGQQVKGLSIDQVRTLIKKQIRMKGFSFNVATGSSTQNIQLSGTARILMGLVFVPRTVGGVPVTGFSNIGSISFKVNNEIIIENADPNFLTTLLMNDEYYYIPRPLSGTDEITLQFTNPLLAEVCNVLFYYI